MSLRLFSRSTRVVDLFVERVETWLGKFSAASLLACAWLLALGCDSPPARTQVLLDVYIESALLAQVDALHLDVRGFAAQPSLPPSESVVPADPTSVVQPSDTTTQAFDLAPLNGAHLDFPLTFALTPRDGDASRRYQATFILRDATADVAVLRVESGFIADKILRLRVDFTEACVGVACGASETCRDGMCQAAVVREEQLPMFDPTTAPGASGQAGASGMRRRAPRGNTAGQGAAGDGSVVRGVDQCGDGMVGPDEHCDTAIVGGPGMCPLDCTSESECELGLIEGVECQQVCVFERIANSPLAQCLAVCGNGMRESDEACDPIEDCNIIVGNCSPDPASCFKGTLTGAPEQCTSACQLDAVLECMSGDGCCPLLCTSAEDSDCSSTCDNGIRDGLETCDGEQFPCPSSCDDGVACTADVMTGSPSQCNVLCAHFAITEPADDDACCPSGADARNDEDCTPVCGNGKREPGELCDAKCPRSSADCDDGDPCTEDSVQGTMCDATCVRTPMANCSPGPAAGAAGPPPVAGAMAPPMAGSSAPPDAGAPSDPSARCGNSIIEVGERCDGSASESDCAVAPECMTVSASCSADCQQVECTYIVTPGCCPTGMDQWQDARCPARCGNQHREGSEECDGEANCVDCMGTDARR